MNIQNQIKQMRSKKRECIVLIFGLIISSALILGFPEHRQSTFSALQDFSLQMFSILPAVLILMGLFSVWTPRELVIKYLGSKSGIKGVTVALFFGALPTGPLYVAFPLAAVLKKKGASTANLVIFLSAWACIKIPQELVEWQFLGLRFMASRLLFTVLLVVLMGFIMQKFMEPGKAVKSVKQ